MNRTFRDNIKEEDGYLFRHMTVAPIYAEEWHIRPPTYDLVENNDLDMPTFNDVKDPRDYPYGQYVTLTNLRPIEEANIKFLPNLKEAIYYINNTFTLNDISFRDDISQITKMKMARRFRHDDYDTFSPYNSF
jgi:hypothetical protein